jgi:hypothetical protein
MLGKTEGKISEDLDVHNWAQRHDKWWLSGVAPSVLNMAVDDHKWAASHSNHFLSGCCLDLVDNLDVGGRIAAIRYSGWCARVNLADRVLEDNVHLYGLGYIYMA